MKGTRAEGLGLRVGGMKGKYGRERERKYNYVFVDVQMIY